MQRLHLTCKVLLPSAPGCLRTWVDSRLMALQHRIWPLGLPCRRSTAHTCTLTLNQHCNGRHTTQGQQLVRELMGHWPP